MHRSEGANWKKSGTRENADRFVWYPPAKCSLCKVAASPGSAVVMSLKAFLSFLKFPLAAVVQFFLLGDLNYNISIWITLTNDILKNKTKQNFPPAGNGKVLNFCLHLYCNLLINQNTETLQRREVLIKIFRCFRTGMFAVLCLIGILKDFLDLFRFLCWFFFRSLLAMLSVQLQGLRYALKPSFLFFPKPGRSAVLAMGQLAGAQSGCRARDSQQGTRGTEAGQGEQHPW